MTIFKSKKNPVSFEVIKFSSVLLLFLLPILFLWNYTHLAILVREGFPNFPHIGSIIRLLAYLILTCNNFIIELSYSHHSLDLEGK